MPEPSIVVKKFSTLKLATLTSPPTSGASVGRRFAGWKSGVGASAETGRTRHAFPEAELPAHVYVITPVRPVTVSPPRSVLDALSGCPPRPIGSTFCKLIASSILMVARSFDAWRALAASPGSTTAVGWSSLPMPDTVTSLNRPSW